jgi:hypothetical protein
MRLHSFSVWSSLAIGTAHGCRLDFDDRQTLWSTYCLKDAARGAVMAKRVITELVDDIDGQTAHETLTFALDGVHYEIDLTSKNAMKLRDAVAPFQAAGTKVGRGGMVRRTGTGRAPARTDREQNQAIRDWAKQHNLEVSDRGRIKQDVVERYHAEVGR